MARSLMPPSFFCGVVRDGGAALAATLEKIDEASLNAEQSTCIIVTNDNRDATDKVLAEWQKNRTEAHIIRLNGLCNNYTERVDRIAFARNIYVYEVNKFISSGNELVYVVDLDGPNINLDIAHISSLVERNDITWDALFPNQRHAYYDVYALRHSDWCPADCWLDVRQASRFPFRNVKRRSAVKKYVYDRQYNIPINAQPISVRSAFGGFGIYKSSCFLSNWYSSRLENGQLICEHVQFNETIYRRGGKLYIVPNLINDAPPEHLGAESGRPFPTEFYNLVQP